MSALVGVAALLVCLAAFLAVGPPRGNSKLALAADRRQAHAVQVSRSDPRGAQFAIGSGAAGAAGRPPDGRGSTPIVQVGVCVVCGIAAWQLVGDALGLMLGFGIAVAGPRLLRKLEPGHVRQRRLSIEMNAAIVADLLAACLASGASTSAATTATAQAVGGPTGELLRQCVAQFELGADSSRVWAPIASEPALAPIARAILRSAHTGAPLTAVLLRVGDDLRATRKAQLDQAAKSVGVKAVGPLGLCFLPAFMLLGVVPLIASLVSAGLG